MRVDHCKVNAISVLNVESLLCEHWEESGDLSHQFKVNPQQFALKIITPSVTLMNMEIIQFGVSNNRATTGHKLQEMSKKCLFLWITITGHKIGFM